MSESLSSAGLIALREALVEDDVHLVQGLTAVGDVCLQCACAVTYCGWKDGTVTTIHEANDYFTKVVIDADARGNVGAATPFLNWFDRVPRETMLREFLPMVERTLEARHEKANVPGGAVQG